MTIERVDDFLNEQYGMSYSELVKNFSEACKILNLRYAKITEQDKEIKHLNDLLDGALKEIEELRSK